MPKTVSYQDISSGTTLPIFTPKSSRTTFRVTPSHLLCMEFNSLVLVENHTFSTCFYIKKDFDQMHVDLFYHILSFKRVFDYTELKRDDD